MAWLCAIASVVGVVLYQYSIWPQQMYAAFNRPDKIAHQWQDVPDFKMSADLKVFWNIGDWTLQNEPQAWAHGFLPISIVDPFSNRADNSKYRIDTQIEKHQNNPWTKPADFEQIVRKDLARVQNRGTLVLDIEFPFNLEIENLWRDRKLEIPAQFVIFKDFEAAYFREWASWYSMPMKWSKETQPNAIVGLYGRQPFQRDYWGVSNKTSEQIEQSHSTDEKIWKHIDPFVDAYFVDIYNFYELPDSVYYMAENIEQNYLKTRVYGNKPIYAYEWLRYHPSNRVLGGKEVAPYLTEAMAIVPFFSGAKGVVLWGYEPQLKQQDGQPYQQLPLYTKSLKRVSVLSEKIARGELQIDQLAHDLWAQHQPLIRRINIGKDECIFMAVNPWQKDTEKMQINTSCGNEPISLEVIGKHVSLADFANHKLTLN